MYLMCSVGQAVIMWASGGCWGTEVSRPSAVWQRWRCGGGGAGSGGSTGMAAQLGWPRRLGRIKVLAVWLSGCLAVWLSGCLWLSG